MVNAVQLSVKPKSAPKKQVTVVHGGHSPSMVENVATPSPDEGSGFRWVLRLDNSATSFIEVLPESPVKFKHVKMSNSTLPSLSAPRRNSFASLHDLIGRMADLPVGHGLAIDKATSEEAQRFLNIIAQRRVDAPKVFAHGGDTVVFEWDFDIIERFLTIAGNEMSLLEMRKDDEIRCEGDVDLSSPELRKFWLTVLGGPPRSSSIVADET